jgi:chaperonin GroEL
MQNVRRFVVKKGDEARQELLAGVSFAADAVRRTLGPHGRNSVSGIRGGTPHITNDGVSILKELWLPNEIQRLGMRTAREAALLMERVGDGTTSVMVLTYAILIEATKRMGYTLVDPATGKLQKGVMAGAPAPMEIKRQIQNEALQVIEELKRQAVPVESEKDLIEAVRVSVEDEEIATMIGQLQWQIGKDGVIVVEDTNDEKDEVRAIPGIRYDNGFPDSRVINNMAKESLELVNIPVIITNAVIETLADFKKQFAEDNNAGIIDDIGRKQKANGEQIEMVVIATKFTQRAMLEIANNGKNGWRIFPVHAPFTKQRDILKDLAALLGGTFVDVSENGKLSDMQLSDVAFASKVEVDRWNSVFAREKDEAQAKRVNDRVLDLKLQLDGEHGEFAQKLLKTEIAQLTGGIGLIKVGAPTQTEQKRKKDKVVDGVAAAHSALQEGVVPGAGLALTEAALVLAEGAILKEPLHAIYKQIQANAGHGFAIESWVRDPLLIVRNVVEKAAEIAGNMVTTEIAIDHEDPPKWAGLRPLESFEDGEVGPDATNPV